MDTVDTAWRKSSYSGANGGNCVEVASPEGAIAVRDSKDGKDGPVLRFTPAAWRSFSEQVKRSLASRPLAPGFWAVLVQ
jgi:hypothetical protein